MIPQTNSKEKEMEEVKNTDAAGAVPADKGQVSEPPTDKKEEVSDSSPEVLLDDKGKPLPWDKQPKWKAARQAEKKLEALLKANGIEDPDELEDLVARGKVVKGKLRDLNDLDKIIEDAEEIRRYRPVWADQEERKRRETEDPEHTIARLEHALKTKSVKEQQKEMERLQAENARKAIEGYDNEVKSLIREMEMPKDQQGFILEFMGVGNPANDIDITDRKAIKRLVSEAQKKKEAYDQAVIKAYLAKKDDIPKVGSSSAGVDIEPPKITMKNAKSVFRDNIAKALRGG
jgi:hypothetical protein